VHVGLAEELRDARACVAVLARVGSADALLYS
jgi:hypothetical protein